VRAANVSFGGSHCNTASAFVGQLWAVHVDVNNGGEPTFAASAKSDGQRKESGHSGHQPIFSIVQPQRRSVVSPYCKDTASRRMSGFEICCLSDAILETAWRFNPISALDCCSKSYSVSLVSSSDKSNPCSAANARVARMLSAAPIR
jgi:hypothetical protein